MTLSVRVAPNTWWPVATLGEASRSVRLWLDTNALGASKWGQGSAPVKNRHGKLVALISYNGRVWTTERNHADRREIVGRDLDVEGGPQ